MAVGFLPALQALQGKGEACALPGNHPVIIEMARRYRASERFPRFASDLEPRGLLQMMPARQHILSDKS